MRTEANRAIQAHGADLIPITDATRRLGGVTRNHIRNLEKRGSLRVVRLGRRVFVPESEIARIEQGVARFEDHWSRMMAVVFDKLATEPSDSAIIPPDAAQTAIVIRLVEASREAPLSDVGRRVLTSLCQVDPADRMSAADATRALADDEAATAAVSVPRG